MKKRWILLGIVVSLIFVAGGCSQGIPEVEAKEYQNIAGESESEQRITTKFSSRSYMPITVQKGVPVRWTILMDAKDLNGCNNAIYIPKLQIQQKLQAGETVIEFTPTEAGIISYSCWMGMIRSYITVVDSVPTAEGGEAGEAASGTVGEELAEDLQNTPIEYALSGGEGGCCGT